MTIVALTKLLDAAYCDENGIFPVACHYICCAEISLTLILAQWDSNVLLDLYYYQHHFFEGIKFFDKSSTFAIFNVYT